MKPTLRQVFGLDPEYNRQLEEHIEKLHKQALEEKWCCTCESYIPVPDNLPGFVSAFPDCKHGGLALETCSKYVRKKEGAKDEDLF